MPWTRSVHFETQQQLMFTARFHHSFIILIKEPEGEYVENYSDISLRSIARTHDISMNIAGLVIKRG
ncbi:MAG: hypothetical protein QW551_04370 [Desulfurococcaceae archaeon]